MRRMRRKVESAMRVHPVEDWSKQLLRRQFRMVCRFSRYNSEWPMRVSHWNPKQTNVAACRSRGRPATRWDDRLNRFVNLKLNIGSWQEACLNPAFPGQEDEYVLFHSEDA